MASDHFDLHITMDNMAVVCISAAPSLPSAETEEELTAELRALGISNSADIAAAVTAYRDAASANPNYESLVLLSGTPPTPPEDEKILWTKEYFRKGFVVDEKTEAIDYRRRVAETVVHEGDLLATIKSAVPGQSGTDVFGDTLSPPPPRPVEIRPGENVRVEENQFHATADGTIRFERGTLSVARVLVIEDSVGLKSGHIKHPGAIVVQKDIEMDSIVEAEDWIEVGGVIEQSTVVTQGDLKVGGGIFGGRGRVIKVEGNLHANFLKNADIECQGDIHIANSIEGCTIKCRGALYTEKGRIAGGNIVVLGGIKARDIGSESHAKTILAIGKDYETEAKLAAVRAKSAAYRTELDTIDRELIHLKRKVDAAQKRPLTDATVDRVKALAARREQILPQVKKMDGEIAELAEESSSSARYLVVATRRIHPGVTISLGGLTKELPDGLDGPVRLVLKDGQIRAMTITAAGGEV